MQTSLYCILVATMIVFGGMQGCASETSQATRIQVPVQERNSKVNQFIRTQTPSYERARYLFSKCYVPICRVLYTHRFNECKPKSLGNESWERTLRRAKRGDKWHLGLIKCLWQFTNCKKLAVCIGKAKAESD